MDKKPTYNFLVTFKSNKLIFMQYAISYVSTVAPNLSEQEIKEVLNFSQNLNIEHNITGILLFSEGNFFQVLEGERNFILG
ncbi:MAG TPA: BLUF domain-containing protein [Gillisia sp.]|nr:BLUF domain-containing protein [Gillisia sp.]